MINHSTYMFRMLTIGSGNIVFVVSTRESWQRTIQWDHTRTCPMQWRLVEEQAGNCPVLVTCSLQRFEANAHQERYHVALLGVFSRTVRFCETVVCSAHTRHVVNNTRQSGFARAKAKHTRVLYATTPIIARVYVLIRSCMFLGSCKHLFFTQGGITPPLT